MLSPESAFTDQAAYRIHKLTDRPLHEIAALMMVNPGNFELIAERGGYPGPQLMRAVNSWLDYLHRVDSQFPEGLPTGSLDFQIAEKNIRVADVDRVLFLPHNFDPLTRIRLFGAVKEGDSAYLEERPDRFESVAGEIEFLRHYYGFGTRVMPVDENTVREANLAALFDRGEILKRTSTTSAMRAVDKIIAKINAEWYIAEASDTLSDREKLLNLALGLYEQIQPWFDSDGLWEQYFIQDVDIVELEVLCGFGRETIWPKIRQTSEAIALALRGGVVECVRPDEQYQTLFYPRKNDQKPYFRGIPFSRDWRVRL